MLVSNNWFNFKYVWLIALLIASSMLYSMFQNAIRGLTSNRLYALSGIFNSILILAFELIGLIVFSMGVEGLLIAQIASYICTILFIYWREKRLQGFFKTPIDRVLTKEIFNYSFPLIPNQISWWIVNSSDRYIILLFLGTAFNGIYSISNKFPTIITTITGVVYFALQETIIKEYNADDRDEFYSVTFEKYYTLLFSLICCAIPATNLIIKWFVGVEYKDAWQFTGFLYLSTVFSALSSFLGIGYQISKETKRSVLSTVSAAGVHLVINLAMVRFIGLHAASFSTFISYLVLFIIRINHSKKYFTLHIKWTYFSLLVLIPVIIMIISYFGNMTINILLTAITSICILMANRTILKTILKKKGI